MKEKWGYYFTLDCSPGPGHHRKDYSHTIVKIHTKLPVAEHLVVDRTLVCRNCEAEFTALKPQCCMYVCMYVGILSVFAKIRIDINACVYM